MPYCLYLRKSRADIEAESHGEGETLARHESVLLELAKRQKLNITEIYKEIVSGDTIASRPMVQKLLSDVEDKKWDGVLVMDVDRLARGDSVDQGIIAQAFKYSSTKIITPLKIYDPNNEYDEEYFEFGLFMARREYKTINRRLQRGRQISVSEGKFIGSKPPYGYDKIKLENQKGYTLRPNIKQAETVRLIFDLLLNAKMGTTLIAKRLNNLNIDNNKVWLSTTVKEILNNPVYTGNMRINSKPVKKVTENGKIKITRITNKDCVIVKGLHEPIISVELWEKAQKEISDNKPVKVRNGYEIQNPLAGIIYCGKCGRSMIRHAYTKNRKKQKQIIIHEQIICPNINCNNVGCKLDELEKQVIKALELWTENYKLNLPEIKDNDTELNNKTLNRIESGLKELEKQSENIHDLLERGVYDVPKFLERQKIIAEKTDALKKEKENFEKSILIRTEKRTNKNELVPKIKKIMKLYYKLDNPKQQNELLKEVVEKIVYVREKGGRWIDKSEFEIELYPKI